QNHGVDVSGITSDPAGRRFGQRVDLVFHISQLIEGPSAFAEQGAGRSEEDSGGFGWRLRQSAFRSAHNFNPGIITMLAAIAGSFLGDFHSTLVALLTWEQSAEPDGSTRCSLLQSDRVILFPRAAR